MKINSRRKLTLSKMVKLKKKIIIIIIIIIIIPSWLLIKNKMRKKNYMRAFVVVAINEWH